jgi:hypothetical protein
MSLDRLRNIVNLAVPTLFRQISGGRVRCESEATLQLHLGRIISTAADLECGFRGHRAQHSDLIARGIPR